MHCFAGCFYQRGRFARKERKRFDSIFLPVFTGCGCTWHRRFFLLRIFLIHSLQPIGLVDYKSLKKSICRVRLFSSRLLKQLIDWASTSFCDRLFHLLITLWEKKYKRVSQRLCFFTNFQVCPLVEVSSAFLKNCDQGVDDNPLTILNNLIMSALFLRSSKDHSPS